MNARNQVTTTRVQFSGIIGVFTVVLLVGIVGVIVSSWIVIRDANYDQRYLELTGELRVLVQQVATTSREATEGGAAAFDQLRTARESFNNTLRILLNGTSSLPSPQAMLSEELATLDNLWERVDAASSTIVDNRDRILFLHEVAQTLNDSIPELQEEYNNVVEVLLENGAPADQVAVAQRQSWLAERIARNVDKMLEGKEDAPAAADQFNLDASVFGSVLKGMLDGNAAMRISRVTDREARVSLEEIAKLFEFVSGSVDEIFQASPDLLKATQAANAVTVDAPKIMDATSTLADRINNLDQERRTTLAVLAFAGLIIASLLLIGLRMFFDTRRRLSETREANERNQNAILRLLDELADLADGDLTATATVTEDFTGAIADSINFTIDQLRVLVSQINETALRVSSAAQESQATALHLAEASEHQAQEIAGASAAVNEMAVTIDQVSSNASESASVAERSVAIANTGAEVVQNTIRGMDNIREQIQETSKRIKRLGESSQEIGDIVSLINDIADQTNILALNAAIQASMAGDAGRGFAVVADEVQRLAERSSAATKQIEALVKTIQSDTNEAVISMEQTTAEVVRGARLAQDAGTALEEIEKVSQELAELIQNISNAARQQASSAGHISNTMNVIQEITSQTSAGTTATARSIGNLAEMANELKRSVAGFKLPEEAPVTRRMNAIQTQTVDAEEFDAAVGQ
ncbi:MAG TPA: methyl-accepting chemotaxis protein [Spongiibacteraceae bacterium]|jgi:twitching motility protein PilJ|nr:methyl-accepting chemotaxis protein [Spongiibacteraceae bacterium]HUH37334.1 methyl-accepting chemotaxis protein [Spongiibacteraceae bacterium]